MNIREIKTEDAEQYLELCKFLDHETIYRPYDPGERNYGVEEQRQEIANIMKSVNSNIFIAEVDHEMVGYISAVGLSLNRLKHITRIVVAIKKEYCGQGIGRKLFETVEKWAISNKIHRIELTVMTDNINALILYKKMGFEIEGVKRHSLLVNGKYADDYYMAKLV